MNIINTCVLVFGYLCLALAALRILFLATLDTVATIVRVRSTLFDRCALLAHSLHLERKEMEKKP